MVLRDAVSKLGTFVWILNHTLHFKVHKRKGVKESTWEFASSTNFFDGGKINE